MLKDAVVRLEQILDSSSIDRSVFKSEEIASAFLSKLGEALARSLDSSGGRFSLILYKERELGVSVSPELAQEFYIKKLREGLLEQLAKRPESVEEIQSRLEEL